MSVTTHIAFAKRIISLILFVCFLNVFLFKSLGILAFALIFSGLFAFVNIVFIDRKIWNSHKRLIAFSSILFILLMGSFVTRANPAIGVFIAMYSLLVIAAHTYILNRPYAHFNGIYEGLWMPFRLIGGYLMALGSAVSFPFSSKMQKKYSSISINAPSEKIMRTIAGVAIALPILFILVALLSSADPIFDKFTTDSWNTIDEFFKDIFDVKFPKRLVASLALTVGFSPFVFFSLKKKMDNKLPSSKFLKMNHEIAIVMSLVTLVFIVFLYVQAPYIFVNVPKETDLLQFGVATYSEYVKKGFTELIVVSMFTFSLIWFGLLTLRNTAKDGNKFLLCAQNVLMGTFGFFILSIFRRVYLYQIHHGWTLSRFYGSLLLVWILMMLGTLFARHFWDKRWVMVEIVMTSVLVVFVGYFNAENFVIRVSPPTVNGRVDHLYLSKMSANGYEGWRQSYDFAAQSLGKQIETNEDYRDFVYSGMVLGELSQNKFKLTEMHGSVEERLAMYLTISKSMKEREMRKIEYLEDGSMKSEEFAKNNSYELGQARKQMREMEEYIRRLENNEITAKDASNYVRPSYYYGTPSKYDYDRYFYYWLGPDSFWPESEPFMNWNKSSYAAYEKMKEDMPIGEIVRMQEEYLVKRIGYSNGKFVFVRDTDPWSIFLGDL